MSERSRIRRRLLVLASMVPVLVQLPAHAQDREFGQFDVVGVGLFVGYTFGERRGVDWGLEGFATRHFQQSGVCDNDPRSGFGPLLRLSALGVSRLSVTAAGHVGGETARNSLAGDFELGGTLALTERGVLGSVHTGATLGVTLVNAYARGQWLLDSYSIGGGARFLPTFGEPGTCDVGRAFRGQSGTAQSCASFTHERFDERNPDAARWAERTREECASISAFLQLALELLDLGAPLPLVARALRAAEQELSHTWAAAHLAARFGRAPLVPCSVAPTFRPRLAGRAQLVRLASESWSDGCLNEGLAAWIAAVEAGETADREEAQICSKIAREEAEHAALAFDVVRWAIARDDSIATHCTFPAQNAPMATSLLRPSAVRELAALNASTLRTAMPSAACAVGG